MEDLWKSAGCLDASPLPGRDTTVLFRDFPQDSTVFLLLQPFSTALLDAHGTSLTRASPKNMCAHG